MAKNRKYTLLLIILPLTLLIAFNIHIFIKARNEKNATKYHVETAEEKYRKTKIKSFPVDQEWAPILINLGAMSGSGTSEDPVVVAKSAVLLDKNTGRALYFSNPSEKMPIASIVKIMTAVVALEHKNLTDIFIVSSSAGSIGENSMGISEGERHTLEDLLYGMVLHSGNDSATAIAKGTAGNLETFVKWMNIKARELGLRDSYFADSCGLNNASYSTSVDLVKLTRYALQNPDFARIVATVNHEIPYSEEHKYLGLSNQTNLLTTYPGVLGVKTGYTEEAGMCLVTYAKNEGKELIGVVLNSADRRGDMIRMLDYGFAQLGVKIDHPLLN